jgi:hypothetical protein
MTSPILIGSTVDHERERSVLTVERSPDALSKRETFPDSRFTALPYGKQT